MRRSVPIDRYKARIAERPEGYEQEIAPAVVERTDEYVTFDSEHPVLVALRAKYPRNPLTPEQIAALEARKLRMFRELWSDLHTRRDWTAEKMERFTALVPCGDCREHWKALLKENPPPYGDDDAVFVWSVESHNAINARLGKDILPLPTARARWGR